MPFSYDISTNIGKVRLKIGDRVQGAGARPGGLNLSDEEISYFLDEASDDLNLASAMACEALANEWAPYPTQTRLGPAGETISAYAYYVERARAFRQNAGASGKVVTAALQTFRESDTTTG